MRITYRLVQFFLFVLVSGTVTYGYLYLPASYQSLDDRIRDLMFLTRGTIPASDDIVIIDIDEKSLYEVGQWPWERSNVSKMIQNLTSAEAGIIGLDIIFSERDKTSPHRFGEQFHLNRPLPNYDQQLAQTIRETPTILGYLFNFDHNPHHISAEFPEIPAIFIEKNLPSTDYLLQPQGILTNIPEIQTNGYSSGFINNVPDASGSIRSVPLLMRYRDTIYPSLAFEMYRIALNANRITLDYSPMGISSLEVAKVQIRTDRNGRLYLNHRGPSHTFHYLSASDVINNTFDKKKVRGKFVLIGTSAYGLVDLRSNPFDNIIPGVEIHATVIDNLIRHDMLHRPDWVEMGELTLIILLTFTVFYGLTRFTPLYLIIGYTVLFGALIYLNYYLLFTHYLIINLVFMIIALSASILSVLGMNFIFEHRQKEQVKKKFAQKVSKQVMDDLLKSDTSDALSTREVEVTIFFSDIRNFTSISEQLDSPQKLIAFLNEYMTAMATSIIETKGTIDKFIGDAIMAYWNAPNDVEHHADMAVQAALAQLKLRKSLHEKFHAQFGIDLDFGIGLNTGTVTVGDIGSAGRSDYTIIGDPVNLASRLEGLCKVYHVRLIISENTLNQLTRPFIIRELDRVRVKGKTESIRIYEVLGAGKADETLQRELEEFQNALQAYYHQRFETALKILNTLALESPHPLYNLYIERCKKLQYDPPKNFEGIYEFHEK